MSVMDVSLGARRTRSSQPYLVRDLYATGRTHNDNRSKPSATWGQDFLDVHPVQLEIWRDQEPGQRPELAMQLSRKLVEGNYRELQHLYPLEDEKRKPGDPPGFSFL